MSSCAGPYTRVFFNARDAAAIRDLADALLVSGLKPERMALPPGRGAIDDLSCDMVFDGGLTVRLSKFLGPKKLFRQTHIYEIDFQNDANKVRGHLFDVSLKGLVKAFLDQQTDCVAGILRDGITVGAEAHERRIELCNGL